MFAINLALDIGSYRLSNQERQQILAAAPHVQILYESAEVATSLEDYDSQEIHVLLSEFAPSNLSRWPRLRLVQLVAAGIDHLVTPPHPIWRTGIPVATASGIHGVPMAQFATGALLMLVHKMPQAGRLQETRIWPDRLQLAGTVLQDRTAGIVGYGSIGRECARQLRALGMRILAMKHNPAKRRDDGFNAWPGTGDPSGDVPEGWFAPDQLDQMLPQCDVLVVTAPRTPGTNGLIGQEELALLRPGARIVVISRGGIVVEAALAEALRSGHIAGAAVDSFATEPIRPDNPLLEAPNIILTPHISGIYDTQWSMTVKLLCENLHRLSSGQPLLNLANGQLGY
jgi:phosphoglycerate dehydrogenase-like enzyme